jgi:hypothetical protein
MSGQAASYYQQDQVQAAPRGQYGQDQSYNNHNGKEESKNSDYQQGYPPQEPPPQQYPPENPPSYDELFKIEKPKFNDIWAGLLVSISYFICLLGLPNWLVIIAHRRLPRLRCRLRHLYQQVCQYSRL